MDNDRVKGVGLGFERQAAGGGTGVLLAEAQRMKKKAMAAAKGGADKTVEKLKMPVKSLKASFEKKEPVDFKTRMIADRRAQKAKRTETKKMSKIEEVRAVEEKKSEKK